MNLSFLRKYIKFLILKELFQLCPRCRQPQVKLSFTGPFRLDYQTILFKQPQVPEHSVLPENDERSVSQLAYKTDFNSCDIVNIVQNNQAAIC